MIIHEVRYPGGYPGSLLDKRMVDTSQSRSAELLRATMIIAMASRMANATIRDGKDADAFIGYLKSSVDEVNYAASNLYRVGDTDPCKVGVGDGAKSGPCSAYWINFESDMPLIEGRIVRLMMAALPEDKAKKFLEAAAKGDVLSAAWAGIKTVAVAANGLRHSAAVYRSNLELAAALGCETFSQENDTLVKAVSTCFKFPERVLFPEPPASITGAVPPNAFHSLMLIARTSCARLPLNTEGGAGSAATRRDNECGEIIFGPKFRPVKQS